METTVPIKTCQRCGNQFEARSIRASHCYGPCFRAKERDYSRRHAATFSPERRRAHILVGCAIAKGELLRQRCEICGSGLRVEAHHDDYAKPLAIRWLCKRHHRQHHVLFGPGKNAFCEEISA
jgi:hypothetical protein